MRLITSLKKIRTTRILKIELRKNFKQNIEHSLDSIQFDNMSASVKKLMIEHAILSCYQELKTNPIATDIDYYKVLNKEAKHISNKYLGYILSQLN